MKMFLELMHSR